MKNMKIMCNLHSCILEYGISDHAAMLNFQNQTKYISFYIIGRFSTFKRSFYSVFFLEDTPGRGYCKGITTRKAFLSVCSTKLYFSMNCYPGEKHRYLF